MKILTHESISAFISHLDREHPEMNLWNLYEKGNILHMNFYEDNIPEDRVKENAVAVKEFVQKLRTLL